MPRLRVTHWTDHCCCKSVRFSEHRFMCRPRDSHDFRLIQTGIAISPAASLRWVHDVFGNSVSVARYSDSADELAFESTFVAERYPSESNVELVEKHATKRPFSYDCREIADLAPSIERRYSDPDHRIDAWVLAVCAEAGTQNTRELLIAITRAIKKTFLYESTTYWLSAEWCAGKGKRSKTRNSISSRLPSPADHRCAGLRNPP